MAESLASDLILKLGTVVAKEVGQEVRLVLGVDKAVEKLKDTFQSLQVLLADAEKRQFKEETIRLWLLKLKDATYDVEDLLDEWNSALQSSSHVENESKSPWSASFSCIPKPCFSFRQVKIRYNIAKQIKAMNERLEQIATDKIRYSLSSTTEKLERIKTTSFDVDESYIFGRDYERATLVEKLCEISRDEGGVGVLSIIGMGGIGKTTLAQKIFNLEEIRSHFQRRIWVCVSDPFDQTTVACAIIESLTGTSTNSMALQTLLEHVSKLIIDQKFLLVLDDVWNEDERKWDPLKNALNHGANGSAILITTRNVVVSEKMGSTFSISLNLMSDEECWSIFSPIAFRGKNMDIREQVSDIGKEIVQKCQGLPLAVRILASLLRFNHTKEEWLGVLDSELWQVDEARSGLFPFLLLSYYDLPSPLKRCFSFCAIFPKDFEIEKDVLIGLWAAQGLLKTREDMGMEVIGEQYLNMLCMRSLFIEVREVGIEPHRTTLKIHDVVHDFVQYLNDKEVMCIHMHHETTMDPKYALLSLVKARHLAVSGGVQYHKLYSIDDVVKCSPCDISSIRAFLVLGCPNLQFKGQLKHFRHLKALHARSMSLKEIPDEIGKLYNLRYLDLSDCQSLKELPETLCNLHNLQILNLHECTALEKLPEGIGELAKLRHLIIDKTHSLCVWPRGMTRLTSLRRMSKFIVMIEDKRSNIGDLKKFPYLQEYLQMAFLGFVADRAEAETAELQNKKQIIHLVLDFDRSNYPGTPTEESFRHFDVIEGLVPPPNVEYLRIYGYRGPKFPNWMTTLTNVTRIRLRYCWKCEILPPLGALPALESLQLREFPRVKEVGAEFLGIEGDNNCFTAFPKLKELEMIGMTNWQEWSSPEESTIQIVMPCLRFVQLAVCSKLKSLPHFLQAAPLEQLMVQYCNNTLESSARSLSHVRDVIIENDNEYIEYNF